MSNLPLLISVPHAGTVIPEEVKDICILSEQDITADGDEGAREIYDIEDLVEAYVTTDVPRAIVDVNRGPDDMRDDGVIKKVTIWNKPVYSMQPDRNLISSMIERYYMPYHQKLTALSGRDIILGIDCHTMVAEAPPIDKEPGKERPDICLGSGDGACPEEILQIIKDALEEAFGRQVAINDPFGGGYIIRSHSSELPWVQLEIARRDFMDFEKKRECVSNAFIEICSVL
ncbi:MAG: N-formylglutamate amidohydrolase [Nitrospirota bacterium]|nr:MAG: N-formylglutamate amidohydrolase [Nitrospirota bacterium]